VGVWALARDARAKSSFGAAQLLDLRNPRNRSEKFWAGSSQGHYADTRLLLAPGFWLLAPGSLLITDTLITDYFFATS
jgi:hypothetical protein